MSKIRNLLRLFLIFIKHILYTKVYKMNIDKTARISFFARLDKTNPLGVNIGKETYIASGTIVFTHDFSRSLHVNTYIGDRCFIGANAIIMEGVYNGNQVVIEGGTW